MIDYMQNHRIENLERMLAALTRGMPVPFAAQQDSSLVPASPAATNVQQSARIDALESSVLALTNSVTLLNQQIANLTTELQKQAITSNMININPPSVDTSQNQRLDGIDSLVQSLSRDVSDYNQQMVDLITQYKSLRQNPSGGRANASPRSGTSKASWF